MNERKKISLILIILVVIGTMDHLSKDWITSFLANKESIEITGFFNLILTHNRGVSFAMFQAGNIYGVWMLIGLTSLLTIVVLYLALKSKEKCEIFAFSLIAGGALGNLFDRIRLGAVIDFLDFHAYGYHWPAFNIADSAICIGVCLLFFHQFFINSTKKQEGYP